MTKRRVTVTVDETLLQEASLMVERGDAESLSAWIGEAMADRVAHDQRLAVLATLVAEYEAEHGEITGDELAAQAQADRDAAAAVRFTVRDAG